MRLEDLPFASDTPLGEILLDAYKAVMDTLLDADGESPKTFHQVIFFQTDGPPANLRPYIKWTSPQHQADRVFYEDNIAIRFLRGNIKKMFDAKHNLSIRIRDTQGKYIDRYKTVSWLAKSATLFAEESAWAEHRRSLNWPPAPSTNDNILAVKRIAGSVLLPGARYELQIVRDDLDEKHKVQFSSTFTTSAFPTFKALVASYKDDGGPMVRFAKARYADGLSQIGEIVQSTKKLARTEWQWQHDQIDQRFETLKDGREGLEKSRLARREVRAKHDALFRGLADTIGDLYYQPVSRVLEVYLLNDAITGKTVCTWIRSPESLDLRLEVFSEAESEDEFPIDYVGRTKLRLQRSGLSSDLKIISVHNSDCTQLLLFPLPGVPWSGGVYTFTLTYLRDYEDESKDIDHRYDRPIEYHLEVNSSSGDVKWLL